MLDHGVLALSIFITHDAPCASGAAAHAHHPEDGGGEGEAGADPCGQDPLLADHCGHVERVLVERHLHRVRQEGGGDARNEEEKECSLVRNMSAGGGSERGRGEGAYISDDSSNAGAPSRQQAEPSNDERSQGSDSTDSIAPSHQPVHGIDRLLHRVDILGEDDLELVFGIDQILEVEGVRGAGLVAVVEGPLVVRRDVARAGVPQVRCVEVLQPQLGAGVRGLPGFWYCDVAGVDLDLRVSRKEGGGRWGDILGGGRRMGARSALCRQSG